MTNEQAIRILEFMKSEMLLSFDHDRKEALKLAISALEKQIPQKAQKDLQPTCNKLATVANDICVPCKDSISRQAVTDLFDAWEAAELDHHIPKILRDRLKAIPSAHPEPCEDAVSRQAVINIINKPVIIKAKEQIEALPSVQPEIIRCKDCKNSEHWYRDRRRCFLWSEDGASVWDSGFCNYAERRTDDER